MGTRGLTCVVLGGQFKIAQYGQWDHYPDGQGICILHFLQYGTVDTESATPTTTLDLNRFKAKIADCVWGSEDQLKAAWEEGKGYKKEWEYLSRDTGSGIVEYVYNAEGPVMLVDSSNFAADSLFCEYAYVVDLDKHKFEIYKGFQKSPVPSEQRFASIPLEVRPNGKPTEYYHVRLLKTYDLDNLPTREQFLKDLMPPEEGVEDEE